MFSSQLLFAKNLGVTRGFLFSSTYLVQQMMPDVLPESKTLNISWLIIDSYLKLATPITLVTNQDNYCHRNHKDA